jgi:hypothetical protein
MPGGAGLLEAGKGSAQEVADVDRGRGTRWGSMLSQGRRAGRAWGARALGAGEASQNERVGRGGGGVSLGAGIDSRWGQAQLRSSGDGASRAGGAGALVDDGASGGRRRLYTGFRASQPRLDGSKRVGDPHG